MTLFFFSYKGSPKKGCLRLEGKYFHLCARYSVSAEQEQSCYETIAVTASPITNNTINSNTCLSCIVPAVNMAETRGTSLLEELSKNLELSTPISRSNSIEQCKFLVFKESSRDSTLRFTITIPENSLEYSDPIVLNVAIGVDDHLGIFVNALPQSQVSLSSNVLRFKCSWPQITIALRETFGLGTQSTHKGSIVLPLRPPERLSRKIKDSLLMLDSNGNPPELLFNLIQQLIIQRARTLHHLLGGEFVSIYTPNDQVKIAVTLTNHHRVKMVTTCNSTFQSMNLPKSFSTNLITKWWEDTKSHMTLAEYAWENYFRVSQSQERQNSVPDSWSSILCFPNILTPSFSLC